MRLFYRFTLLLGLFPTLLTAQSSALFQKIYGPHDAQKCVQTWQISQGLLSAGQIDNRAYLRLYDQEGDFLWEKQYELPQTLTLSSAARNAAGNILLACNSLSAVPVQDQTLVLICTDSLGNLLWSRNLNAFAEANTVKAIDDGFLIAGNQNGDTFGQIDGAVSLIDSAGNLLWSRTLGVYPKFTEIVDMMVQEDSLFYLGTLSPPNTQAVLIRTNRSTGFMEWTRNLGNVNPSSLFRLNNGNFLISGNSTDVAGQAVCWASSCDPNGQTLWTKTYHADEPLSLRQAFLGNDESLLLLTSGPDNHGGLVKLNPNGEVLWAQYYGSEGPTNLDQGIQLSDSSLLICGSTDTINGNANNDALAYMLRLSPQGDLPDYCCKRSFAVTVTNENDLSIPSYLADGFFIQSIATNNDVLVKDQQRFSFDFCAQQCPPPLCDAVVDLGADLIVCKDTVVHLSVSTNFTTVLWSDGSTGYQFNASGPGVFWVQATDSCDVTQSDTLFIATAPSQVNLTCPQPLSVETIPGKTSAEVDFDPAQASTNCLCGGLVTDLNGPASGSNFPVGETQLCYTAADACDNTASCCFTVTVTESPEIACDTKIASCIRFELLKITVHPNGSKTVRLRVTNNCNIDWKYLAFQLPQGITALEPAMNSVYTAPSDRIFLVANPSFSSFYGIRFTPEGPSGLSDIFEYTLPPQAQPAYILAFVRLANGQGYQAHLSTFNCLEAQAELASKERNQPNESLNSNIDFSIYPNPSGGRITLESATSSGPMKVSISGADGKLFQEMQWLDSSTPFSVDLPTGWPNAWYIVAVEGAGQWRFLLQR